MTMRSTLILAFLLLSAGVAHAADKPPQVPPPPPLPPATATNQADAGEPEVTIAEKPDAKVTEYRANGRLYMIRVQPKVGPAYYLVDETGQGSFVRRDTDPKISPPRWTITRF
jgi:hypothetical protein